MSDRRPGRILDDPAVLEATMIDDELRLAGPGGSVAISLRLWPPSARDAIHDELEAWGIVFGHRHDEHHHARRRDVRR